MPGTTSPRFKFASGLNRDPIARQCSVRSELTSNGVGKSRHRHAAFGLGLNSRVKDNVSPFETEKSIDNRDEAYPNGPAKANSVPMGSQLLLNFDDR